MSSRSFRVFGTRKDLENLLEYPQYTRPQNFMGMEVPEVLMSGDHEKVRKWRYEQALEITKRVRPDLLTKNDAD